MFRSWKLLDHKREYRNQADKQVSFFLLFEQMLMKIFYQGFSYDLVRKIKHLFAEFADEQSPISGQIFHLTSGISDPEK